ncbi:hypothetical protein AZE42_11704 [Rhizopogon vesiculosus]|uniref:Uncharacterized protein n=1 Tax=Rhizopogon vesiculosus TaxID=180088 RepID=A0A1J8Q9F3_9AGAM|nr:hypothetical protein AZE42_11704 [Rhizopogon vesiculosus]
MPSKPPSQTHMPSASPILAPDSTTPVASHGTDVSMSAGMCMTHSLESIDAGSSGFLFVSQS